MLVWKKLYTVVNNPLHVNLNMKKTNKTPDKFKNVMSEDVVKNCVCKG